MFKPKSNSPTIRRAPTDLDESPAPLAPVLEFDYERCNDHGRDPWPTHHYGQKFGPSLIRKALKAGLYVMAEIDDAPRPVAVSDAHWAGAANNVFEVVTAEGARIPTRVFTLRSLKGYKL